MLARVIKLGLTDHEFDVFLDTLSRDGAGSFPLRLRKAIAECGVFICLLNATTLESPWVRKEIELACRYEKVMIPLFQEDYVPPDLVPDENVQQLLESDGFPIYDKRNEYIDEAIDKLAQMIWDTPGHLLLPTFEVDDSGALVAVKTRESKEFSAMDKEIDPFQQARELVLTSNAKWVPEIRIFTVHGIDFPMCLVPPGRFKMGSMDGIEHERPVYTQEIAAPFWIGLHPVTNAQWGAAEKASNGAIKPPSWNDWYNQRNMDDHPIVGVNWYQCRDFARWLGNEWNLPTETQWEYAARGPDALIYPWGNTFDAKLVIYDESNGRTAPIAGRPAGASWVGAQDMSGNVWEWCLTKWRDNYDIEEDNDPVGEINDESERVVRGGSWYGRNYLQRTATRTKFFAIGRRNSRGFRLCYYPG